MTRADSALAGSGNWLDSNVGPRRTPSDAVPTRSPCARSRTPSRRANPASSASGATSRTSKGDRPGTAWVPNRVNGPSSSAGTDGGLHCKWGSRSAAASTCSTASRNASERRSLRQRSSETRRGPVQAPRSSPSRPSGNVSRTSVSARSSMQVSSTKRRNASGLDGLGHAMNGTPSAAGTSIVRTRTVASAPSLRSALTSVEPRVACP